jgi:hypothetical protein
MNVLRPPAEVIVLETTDSVADGRFEFPAGFSDDVLKRSS